MKFLRIRVTPSRDPKRKVDENDFSDFFVHANSRKQKKVIKYAIDSANERQKALLQEVGHLKRAR